MGGLEMTSRELVYRTLEFRNKNGRAPRDLWALPWAQTRYPDELRKIREDFPSDFIGVDPCCRETGISEGDAYKKGRHVDSWGCIFENNAEGYIGEVKEAIVDDDDWEDTGRVHFPTELFSMDIDAVNAQCRASDKFVFSGVTPRPFEQLQFMRTTERLMLDLADPQPGFLRFIGRLHTFYCDLLELWAKTEVDSLNIMDDWGTQTALLINPKTWRRLFKPLYKDYIDIAHRNGKKMFLHSDGHTLAIYPDLIELGLDAYNSQIFCMGVDALKPYAGKITFWGEVDRQNLLPFGTVDEVKAAVKSVRDNLWVDGGAIAECEFSVGGNPANVRAVYEAWM
jgi:hypothetical protein